MKKISRREFVKISSASVGIMAISTGLTACFDGDSNSSGNKEVSFTHGIASGDPQTDKVIIWTRVQPTDSSVEQIDVSWEVASDSNFTELLHTGSTKTSSDQDYTVKVDVQNLDAGTSYFYRFKSNGKTSVSGTTKTLPEGAVESVKLAVFSCANYPAGHFHVYQAAAERNDLDAVLHLGDYIYEYGQGGYATEDAETLGRTFAEGNTEEIVSLVDYRNRYALYRSDSSLQDLHAKVAFISVWDDHEVANDTYKDGAENHDDTEGDFEARKMAALQAYFEWMPIRPVIEDNQEIIYRHFDFGNLVSLYMLDTRVIARDKQLDYTSYFDPTSGEFNALAFAADVSDENRSLLGSEQLVWLQQQMAQSTATWQVLGQQVLMGRMNLPAELLTQLINPDPSVILPQFEELATIKGRILAGDPSITEVEQARIDTVLPYNLDAWDGYAYEREVLFGSAQALGKNLVVVAGDTHNAWANNLKTLDGRSVGVEFATSSVTSPGLEDYLSLPDDAQTIGSSELGITTLIDELKYLNINQRGYMTVTFTQSESQADWHFVDTIKDTSYNLDTSRSKSLKVLPGSENLTLQEL